MQFSVAEKNVLFTFFFTTLSLMWRNSIIFPYWNNDKQDSLTCLLSQKLKGINQTDCFFVVHIIIQLPIIGPIV